MDLDSLMKNLQGLPIPDIHFYPSTGSTNADALLWATQGAQDGSLVVADQQTAGRGRLGRKWVTIPGAALAFTLILRPVEEEAEQISLFSPLGALAVSQAIEKACNLLAPVKWPNDVLINCKKVCGVLAETNWRDGHLDGLALGIGINIAPASIPNRIELLFPATCLNSECGYALDREQFLRAVLTEFFNLRPLLGSRDFMQLWEKQLAFKGEPVQVEMPDGKTVTGTLVGINENGNLVLQPETGESAIFPIGDVKLRPN